MIRQARNGQEALDAVASQKPDVLITDIEMLYISVLDVAAELKLQRSTTPTIILTTFARAGYLLLPLLDAGASGYLLQDKSAKELADAVRGVHQGLRVIDPELVAEAWGEPDPLTDRERQVVRLAGEGVAGVDTAQKLGLSEGTVRELLIGCHKQAGRKHSRRAARIRAGQRLVVSLHQRVISKRAVPPLGSVNS